MSDREGICVFPGRPVDQDSPGHPVDQDIPGCPAGPDAVFFLCFLDVILRV